MMSCTLLGHCAHSAGHCPGATSSRRAERVPHTAQGTVTTIASTIWARALASCSRSQARACGVLALGLAYPVKAYFDRFPVQDPVAAADPLPRADRAQLGRGDRCLDAEAVQVLQVIVGHEPGMAAAREVRRGEALEIPSPPGKHALLAVESLADRHAEEPGARRVLVVFRGLVAAHQLYPPR